MKNRTQVTEVDDILVVGRENNTAYYGKEGKIMKVNFNNPIFKKVLKVGGVVITGLIAASNALSDQKKDAEFEEMKKFVNSLKAEKES